jgi:hypothetical protein
LSSSRQLTKRFVEGKKNQLKNVATNSVNGLLLSSGDLNVLSARGSLRHAASTTGATTHTTHATHALQGVPLDWLLEQTKKLVLVLLDQLKNLRVSSGELLENRLKSTRVSLNNCAKSVELGVVSQEIKVTSDVIAIVTTGARWGIITIVASLNIFGDLALLIEREKQTQQRHQLDSYAH